MLNYTNTTTELTKSDVDTVVIPIGATEQFGPYLPMHIDSLIAELYGKHYGEVLNAYVLPVMPFNTSEEHAGFKGTVTLSPTTMMVVLEDVIVGLQRQGFRKFVLVAGHGGSYWMSSFIKHINYKYPEILVIHPHHQAGAWDAAVKAAGLDGRNDIHGGLLGVCTAMWLCPELVTLSDMGSVIPKDTIKLSDYMGWDKLTRDGNWGEYVEGECARDDLAKKGKTLWMTLISRHCEGLKEHLEEAYARKMEALK